MYLLEPISIDNTTQTDVGTAGEFLVAAALISYGCTNVEHVQNDHFDIVARPKGIDAPLRIEVKTKISKFDHSYTITKGPRCAKKPYFTAGKCDIIAFVNLENQSAVFRPAYLYEGKQSAYVNHASHDTGLRSWQSVLHMEGWKEEARERRVERD